MNRILPEMVLAAYEDHEMMPVQGTFFDKYSAYDSDDIKECACGIGMTYLSLTNGPRDGSTSLGWADARYGSRYVAGFLCGFDNGRSKTTEEEYLQGYEDGKACWLAVKHLA